jgi:hypothetical protein
MRTAYRELLARQLALKEAGPMADEYFRQIPTKAHG